MAGYRGHIAGAGLFCVGYVAVLTFVLGLPVLAYHGARLSDWQYVVALFVLAITFGLWPDVDTNSKAQNVMFSLLFVADIVLIATHRLEAAAYLGFLAMLPIVGKHRGWTHTFLAMVLVPLPIILGPLLLTPDNWKYAIVYYGAAVTGYFSHLFFDGLVGRHKSHY